MVQLEPHFRNGIEVLDIPALDPYKVPAMNVSHTSSVTSVQMSGTNIECDKMYNYKLTYIDFRPQEGILKGRITFPLFLSNADYSIYGTLAKIPLIGNGKTSSNVSNAHCDFVITNPGGLNSCGNVNVKLHFKAEDLKVYVYGLASEDTTNAILNENSKTIAAEMSPTFEKLFEILLTRYFNNLCKKIPFNQLVLYLF